MRLFLILLAIGWGLPSISLAAPASIAEIWTQEARYKDWRLFIAGSGADKTCTLISEPKSYTPANVRRGDVYITVSHRPAQETFYEIAVHAGYPFSVLSEPFATIDNHIFKFFSGAQIRNDADETAWLYHLSDNAKIIKTMQSGAALHFKGTSARGTLVEDHYSLFGFTAASAALDAACPRIKK